MTDAADNEDRLADFDRKVNDARRHADERSLGIVEESVRSMVEAMQEVGTQSHHGSDPTGTVSATVTGQGELSGVQISAYAIRDLSPAELGAACVAAIGTARLRCSEAVAERLTDLFGSARVPTGEDGTVKAPDLGALSALLRETAERIR